MIILWDSIACGPKKVMLIADKWARLRSWSPAQKYEEQYHYYRCTRYLTGSVSSNIWRSQIARRGSRNGCACPRVKLDSDLWGEEVSGA